MRKDKFQVELAMVGISLAHGTASFMTRWTKSMECLECWWARFSPAPR